MYRPLRPRLPSLETAKFNRKAQGTSYLHAESGEKTDTGKRKIFRRMQQVGWVDRHQTQNRQMVSQPWAGGVTNVPGEQLSTRLPSCFLQPRARSADRKMGRFYWGFTIAAANCFAFNTRLLQRGSACKGFRSGVCSICKR